MAIPVVCTTTTLEWDDNDDYAFLPAISLPNNLFFGWPGPFFSHHQLDSCVLYRKKVPLSLLLLCLHYTGTSTTTPCVQKCTKVCEKGIKWISRKQDKFSFREESCKLMTFTFTLFNKLVLAAPLLYDYFYAVFLLILISSSISHSSVSGKLYKKK